jgi:hypothetical protein
MYIYFIHARPAGYASVDPPLLLHLVVRRLMVMASHQSPSQMAKQPVVLEPPKTHENICHGPSTRLEKVPKLSHYI